MMRQVHTLPLSVLPSLEKFNAIPISFFTIIRQNPLEHNWHFLRAFCMARACNLNLDRRTDMRLLNRFRIILYYISLRDFFSCKYLIRRQWQLQCSKRNGSCFSCASIKSVWVHLGSRESTREAREAREALGAARNLILTHSWPIRMAGI